MTIDPIPCDFEGSYETDTIPDGFPICQAVVDIPPSELHPPLVTHGTDSRLYFATGRRSGWYTAQELRYCQSRYGNASVKISQGHQFKVRPLFNSFVADLYAIKKSAKGPLAECAKLILNSLYGKTSMATERERIVAGHRWHDWPHNDPAALRRFAARGEIPYKRVIDPDEAIYGIPDRANFAAYIQPQIAATVTARSRLLLQSHLDHGGDRVCYCDTDSVYAEVPKSFFPTSKELGGLKFEGEIDRAIFAAAKTYVAWKGETITAKAKGVRANNPNDVLDFIAGKPVQQRRMVGIFEARSRGLTDKIQSVITEKKANHWNFRRHESGRAFSVAELAEMGIIAA